LFWGAGFLFLFLYNLAVCVLQSRIIKRKRAGLRLQIPRDLIVCGNSMDIHYEISRPFIRLPGVIIEVSVKFIWRDRLIRGMSRLAAGSLNGMIRLHARRRGAYFCSGAVFRLRDYAGFFSLDLTGGQEERFTVLSESSPPGRELRLMTPGGEQISRRNRKKQSDELIESRQYFPGDDIRRINWKAFAHSGELFLRVGEEKPLPESKLTIVLDLGGPSGLVDDKNNSLYLDFLIARLSGIMEELTAAGISLELSVPPSPFEADWDAPNLSALWWRESLSLPAAFSSGHRIPGRHCLLLCSPFPCRADELCRNLTGSGWVVTAAIPIPGDFAPPRKTDGLKGLFLTREAEMSLNPDEEAVDIMRAEALKRCRELKIQGGAADAFLT